VALIQADERRKAIPLASQEFFQAIAANCGVDRKASREKRSNEVQQRNQMIRETRKQTQMTLKEIGILFGGLSESMVSKILEED
jgi:DNA-directed RNA polymerase specialized sigma subunit